jgi:hypothetical protein
VYVLVMSKMFRRKKVLLRIVRIFTNKMCGFQSALKKCGGGRVKLANCCIFSSLSGSLFVTRFIGRSYVYGKRSFHYRSIQADRL